jgi:stage II sporulation protein E
MGSGTEANSYSNDIAGMFCLLAGIGVDVTKAIELVNLSMCIKSERECFSTLDIVYVDFESNNITIIKAGTSPTYVVTGQEIKKYECNSLPVGILKDIQIQKYTIPIADDMLILMTSDGISNSVLRDDAECDWICELLKNQKNNNPQKISELAVKEAVAQNEGVISDDMTSYVLKIVKQ